MAYVFSSSSSDSSSAESLDWETVPHRVFNEWPSDQALPDHDIEKLRSDGIEFINKISSGNFAEVWETKLTKLKKDEYNNYVPIHLACKVSSLKRFRNKPFKEAIKCLLQEFEILKEVSHPHIVSIEHSIRVIDDTSRYGHFLEPIYMLGFMEICDGNLLNMIQYVGQLSEDVSNNWLVQIANALQYLHNSGIAHLDIKPQNILYLENPADRTQILVKLTDFGLSLSFSPGVEPLTDRNIGTEDYKAPELLTPGVADAFKTDIYSLGMSLVESLAGVDYSDPPLMFVIVDSIQNRDPVTDIDISQDLQDLIRGMTMKDPNQRFDIEQVVSHRWTRRVPYIPGQYFSLD